MTYTDSMEFISVYWEGYVDPESGVRMYKIRLLNALSCREEHENRIFTVVNSIDIESNYSEYKFVDLNLQVSILHCWMFV